MNKPRAGVKPHVHAEVIKAWADGAEIEYFSNRSEKWIVVANNNPCWSSNEKYRVKPKVTHKIGNKYDKSGSVYLLASVGNHQVSLINIETGYRWAENVKADDVNLITEEEFSSACSYGEFELIND